MTVLLDLSEDPLVCRWNTVNILCLIPDSFIKALQNWETKSLSWSVMSSSGQPFSQNHRSKKMVAKSSVVMLVLQAAIWTSAPSLSVIITMQSNPLSFGKGPMKSMARESKCLSGMGNGWRGPAGFIVRFLFCWQSVQEGTYAFMRSLHMLGQ